MAVVAPSLDAASVPSIEAAASLTPNQLLDVVGSRVSGLTTAEVAARLEHFGPNAVRSHHASAWSVLSRQIHSPLLWLLLAAAAVSGFVGEGLDALIIGVIVAASVGLGFANEFRAERAAEAMHSDIRHDVATTRDGETVSVEVTHLVPGDIVHLGVGSIVPADVRLLTESNLECDESILTGESVPAEKSARAVASGAPLAELSSCLFMGTVVHEGSADAVVVATGSSTQFGRIAVGLGEHHPQTEFQLGLTRFSGLLAKVGGVLSVTIFAINIALGRPVIDAVLFSLAVAVGITPQLLPAVVSTSLATGSRRLAEKKVLVKRLVCIEDLGDIDVLFTDKTGTLTDGHITFERAITATGDDGPDILTLGLVCNEATPTGASAVGGNPLDVALWEGPGAATSPVVEFHRVAIAPFDHERRCASVLAEHDGQQRLITKGAPEAVLDRCIDVPDEAHRVLDTEFSAGNRVVAIASRVAPELTTIAVEDEHDLTLAGFLVFLDQPKPSAAASIARLAELGITVKIVTGDNPLVAETVCRTLGVDSGGTLTGVDLDRFDDTQLTSAVNDATIFARVSPEQKARILRAQRRAGSAVAFLGDGVNDALALHHADVGISVDSATDVAKDAADIILLERDLAVLADGVAEGRRIFANTIKYVLMGTSSNFGNMFSVTVAAAFLPFLPMLPFQILLNNLLYDSSQMTIPTDRVDEEQLARPSHWDIGFIRRFMIRFGPISSIFDFATFAVMLWVFDADAPLFRSGWFVESLATQTLIVFVIRTRRVPFIRSRPSRPLLASVVAVVTVGALIPQSPINETLGFAPLPPAFFAMLVAFVVAYLACVEVAKYFFYKTAAPTTPSPSGADTPTASTASPPAGATTNHCGPEPTERRPTPPERPATQGFSVASASVPSVVAISGLVKRFGSVLALDGLDLDVAAGEVHGFLGPNGSGKTTTIRVLLGLLHADAGEVRLLGGDPWHDTVQLHRRIAYVPGDVSLWPKLTGGEVIDLFGRLRGDLDPDRRDELIARFELDPTKRTRSYSKGNRQKVALIAGLASSAELLIMDEPTAGLDPLMEAVFQACIEEVRQEGRSVLLSSHILAEVEALCDRVTIIRAGRTVEAGTLASLRQLTRTSIIAQTARPPDGLADHPGVHGFERRDGTVRFDVDTSQLADVIRRLSDAGLRSLQSTPPTLEEMFLRHYGDELARDLGHDAMAEARVPAVRQLDGTANLVSVVVRRDRVRLAVWVTAIVLLVLVTAVSTKDLFPTQAKLDQVAAVSKDNPAALAFNGPPIALDTMGGQVAFQLGAFGLTMVGLMSLLMTSRLTRGEEESGRLELVRAMPVGRHAPLAAAALVVGALNVVVGALTALSLIAEQLPVTGSVALGASFTALGLLYMGLTALTAQVTDNSRVAAGLAGGFLGASYTLRAVGDAGGGSLSWLSPIGLAQKSRPYGGEQWWPLLLCVLIGGGLLTVAVLLADRRDFGSGLFPARPGPARAAPSLGSERGLAVRVQRATVLWWTVGVLALALTCGSLASTIQDFVADNDALTDYFNRAGVSLTDSFLATSLLLLALLPAGAAAQMLVRARSEETANRTEAILATRSTRRRWLGSHVTVALLGSSLALVIGGVGLGVSAAWVLRDAGEVPRLTVASLAYLPAVWLVLGVAVALIGLAPRAVNAVWGVWSFCLVLAFFGTLIDFPEAVRDLSPFQHVPLVPASDVRAVPLAIMLLAGAALTAAGGIGFRRRDIG